MTTQAVKVGDLVIALGHPGRWEVVKIEGNESAIKLLATNKETGDPVSVGDFDRALLSTLTVLTLE
jgi:hypothetical protein